MKRFFLLVFLSIIIFNTASSQVINFGKTLPVRAYSLTLAPVLSTHNFLHRDLEGLSYLLMGGYGIGYDVDFSVKYGYTYAYTRDGFVNSADFFGIEMQYLFRETRKSYYSFFGGIHKWEEYGIDLTVSYTFTPKYLINLSAGLDLDVDFTNTGIIENPVPELRAWIPLNFGWNFDDRYFLFLEYDLPVTQFSWDILGGGITFIFR
jgi:hypothetical protein